MRARLAAPAANHGQRLEGSVEGSAVTRLAVSLPPVGASNVHTRRRAQARRVSCRGFHACLIATAVWLFVPSPARGQIFDKIIDAGEKAADVAEKVESVLPIGTEEEVNIGRGVAATLAGHYTLDRDEGLTEYLNLVGSAVAAVDPRPDIRYRFGVLASDQVNALSAPGGYILVTRGALNLMEDEAELAGVLAHEVAHVNQKHVIEEIQKRARTALGAEVAQDALDANSEVFDQIVGLGANVLMTGLSREDELEADRLGAEYATAAGYDPTGLGRFVAKLEENESKPFLAALKKTHPKPETRLKELQKQTKGANGGARLPERFRAAVGSAAPAAAGASTGATTAGG